MFSVVSPFFLMTAALEMQKLHKFVKPKYQVIQQMIQRASCVSIEARTSAQLSEQRVTSSTLQILFN